VRNQEVVGHPVECCRRTFPCMMSRSVSVEGSETVSSNESASSWLWFVSVSTTTLLFWSAAVEVLVSRQPTAVVGTEQLAAGSARSTGGHSADGWGLAASVAVAAACIPAEPSTICLSC